MDYSKEIRQRISRRSYLNEPVESEKAAALINEIKRLNEASGLSMEFLEDGGAAFKGMSKSYGMFQGVRSLIVLKGPKSDPHLREKAGYYGELMVLLATGLGLGTCWVGGTFDRENGIFGCREDEALICVVTVGKVSPEKTLKEKLIYQMVHRSGKTVSELLASDAPPPQWLLCAMEAVQKAPSAKNSQRVKFEYTGGVLSAAVPDSYQFDLVDLGIAKRHFELSVPGRFALGNHGIFTKEE